MRKAFVAINRNLPALFWFALLALVLSESFLLAFTTWGARDTAHTFDDDESSEQQYKFSSVVQPAPGPDNFEIDEASFNKTGP